MSRHSIGFTLIEVLVTIAIAALLLYVAVPGFSSMLIHNKISSTAYNYLTGFSYARSEALRRRTDVSVVPVDGSSDWSQGYSIRADTNGDGDLADDGEVLRIVEPSSGVSIKEGSAHTLNTGQALRYNARGFLTPLTASYEIVISASGCHGRGARIVRVGGSGQARVMKIACP